MCYSVQIWADHKKYTCLYNAKIDVETFVELFWSRLENDKTKIPKALQEAFGNPHDDQEQHIKCLIDQHKVQQASKLEQELFKQRTRLADAKRTLQTKTTKAAQEAQRIAGTKIKRAVGKLSDLRRNDLTDSDSRIYPRYYAPVMIVENGH